MCNNEINVLDKIPSTIVQALIDDNDCVIHNIHSDSKILVECVEDITEAKMLTLSCYSFEESRYIDFEFEVLCVAKKIVQKYSNIYTLIVTGNFKECYSLIYHMNKLFDNKSRNDIGSIKGFMKEKQFFCNYPYEEDKEFFGDYTEQRLWWFRDIKTDDEYKTIMRDVEMAYFFVNFSDYNEIIENGCRNTIQNNLAFDGITHRGIFIKEFERVYIGSEFCHNMIPDKLQLKKILNICILESYKITVAFPYLLENEISNTDELLYVINEIAESNGMKIEILINDWGMIELVNKYRNLSLVLGRLLNKRKKDPRIEYIWNYKNNSDLLKKNYLNNEEFLDGLKNMGITRFEFEDHLTDNELIDSKCSLHFPYYQINTSMFCTMYAECKKYNKFKQSLISNCPKYCDNYVYLYPKHLNIIGRGNSILGFNNKIFTNKKHLKKYIDMGIDRLVYSGY